MTAVVSRLLIIADDLTGATDVGAQLAARGISTLVVVDAAAADARDSESCQVLVVNTESRHVDGRAASEQVMRAYRWASETGYTHFYKKTDSTLEGNIGMELDAFRRAAGRRVLPFVPAFPRLGRVTREGRQYVANSVLEGSDIAAILRRQSYASTRLVRRGDLTALEQGAPLTNRAGERADEEGTLLIFDAATDDDVRRIGKCLAQHGLLDVVAGASGLAEQLPDLLTFTRSSMAAPSLGGPMLVVNGSLSAESRRQVNRAANAGVPLVTLPTNILTAQEGVDSAQASEILTLLERLAADGRDAIVQTQSDESAEDPDLALARRIASNIAAIVGRVMQRASYQALTVVGGDTLGALAHCVGWRRLRPLLEIVPGVVAVQIVDPPSVCLLLTKPGAYGADTVFLDIKAALGNPAS